LAINQQTFEGRASMFGKGKDEDKGPQELKVTWGDDQQRKAMLHASLFQVAGQVTQICLTTGKPPEEVVATYTKAYELLMEWYHGTPFKAQLKEILDSLYPDPASYEPGEKLVE
jgi:hypothetical protein